jgi:hypothetical protein
MVHSEMPEQKNHAKGPSFVKLRSAGLLISYIFVRSFSSRTRNQLCVTFFSDYMVLQLDREAVVWGWANPQEHIWLSLDPPGNRTSLTMSALSNCF